MSSFFGTTEDTFFLRKKTINLGGKLLNLDEPLVMGILNLTPDSFYDGGKYTLNANTERVILDQVKSMISEGASIIDIGGYSSRPGAKDVSVSEELERVIPIIELIHQEFPDLPISIDTFRSGVAIKAIEAGAHIVNDISGGDMDANMISTVSSLQVPYIMMHMQGNPQNMQDAPNYSHVTQDVIGYFEKKLNVLEQHHISDIIIDPGFGFGKSVEHNYQLLKELDQFKLFKLPVLVGVSRKSMINKVLNTTPQEALNGTTALNMTALLNGANILRVHDVKEAHQCVQLFNKLRKV